MSFLAFYSQDTFAQVRIIQWSDTHSTLESKAQQIAAIDAFAQDFYSRHPRGEFVVFVLGDFTSINPYSQVDQGQLSFEALRVLKSKGYTVIFTPGNHDAFDWTGRIDGSELFLQQMRQLHEWGIPILAANLKKLRKPLRNYVIESYALESLEIRTHILGLTLETLYEKSNLTEATADKLFKRIEKYEPTLFELLPRLKNESAVEQVFIGIHHGHKRLAQLAENLHQTHNPRTAPQVSLLMGADDHLVASYKKRNTLITDAGSHGSFNVIDVERSGRTTIAPILHVSINQDSARHINMLEFVHGQITLNERVVPLIKNDPLLRDYRVKVENFIAKANQSLQTTLVETRGIETHKRHMKLGRTDLGSTLAEALVNWTKSLPILRGSAEPIIAMVNSSSYRVEAPIPRGPMTEFIFREMYPFLNESTVYRLRGKDIESLFFSLRKLYAHEDERRYSPQLNFNIREHKGKLQILIDGKWENIKSKTSYLVAFDGWLSEHRYGQSFRSKNWIQILQANTPIATEIFQEVLVKHMPRAISDSETKTHVAELTPNSSKSVKTSPRQIVTTSASVGLSCKAFLK